MTKKKKQQIVGTLGINYILTKTLEEFSELNHRLAKELIGDGDVAKLHEEMADVKVWFEILESTLDKSMIDKMVKLKSKKVLKKLNQSN